jgi:hypothetical protein
MPAPRRSTRRSELNERKAQSKADQNMLYIVLGVVGALGLLIVFAVMSGDDPLPESAPETASAATAAGGAKTAATPIAAEDPHSPASSDPLRGTVERVLRAVQEGDLDSFTRSVSFPQMHDAAIDAGAEGKRWRELDSLGQTMARKKIAESLTADEKTRDFMRQANIDSFIVMEKTDKRAKVQVIQKHMIETDRRQERVCELEKADTAWYLTKMSTGPIQTPHEMQTAANAARADERARRAERGLGTIQKQERPSDTPADVVAKIDAACAVIADPGATKGVTKAKQELATIGKPAIPALLNVIAGREEFTTNDDGRIVSAAVDALKMLTGEDFGFSPAGLNGRIDPNGDIKKEAVLALRRLFGWWEQNKTTWSGPRAPKEDEEEGS